MSKNEPHITANVKGEELFLSTVVDSERKRFYVDSMFDRFTVSYSDLESLVIKRCKIKILVVEYSTIARLNIFESDIDEISIEGEFDDEMMTLDTSSNQSSQIKYGIGGFHISTKSSVKNLTINGASIRYFTMLMSSLGKVELNRSCFDSFKIENQTKIETFHISGCLVFFRTVLSRVMCKELIFSDHQINQLHIADSSIKRCAIGCMIAKRISLRRCDVDDLTFTGITLESVSVVNGSYRVIQFLADSIGNTFISSDRKSELDGINIQRLDFSNYPKGAKTAVKINDGDIGILDLSNFVNNGEFELTHTIIGECKLILSNLTNASFNNVRFDKINLYNSIINDARFHNIRWPEDHLIDEEYHVPKVKIPSKDFHKTNYLKLAESYRQLKLISINSNDKYSAIAFHHRELNYTLKYVNEDRKKKLGNWLILWTNKVFSDFGQSLTRPVGWLILFHSILFTVLIHNFDLGVRFSLHSHSWPVFWKGVGIYLNLLSPVHEAKINEVSIYGVTDFFIRICTGYFIYYFIRATRKFHMSI